MWPGLYSQRGSANQILFVWYYCLETPHRRNPLQPIPPQHQRRLVSQILYLLIPSGLVGPFRSDPGGGTASLKVGAHCQTTAPAFWRCPPLRRFLPPLYFRVIGHRSPKSNIINTKLSKKGMQGLLHSFVYKECHVFHKIEGIQT